MNIANLFKKTEYLDYDTYKTHIDFLDDIYYKQRLMKKKLAEV